MPVTSHGKQTDLKLSHVDLIKFMNVFHERKKGSKVVEPGYQMDLLGICYGIACMGMQAILANELQVFRERLILISNLIENPKIKELLLNNGYPEKTLKGKHKQAYIDLKAFFDGVALYFIPKKYNTVLPEIATQFLSMSSVFNLVKSGSLKDNKLNEIHRFSGCYTLEQLANYLQSLTKIINKHKDQNPNYSNHNLAFLLSSHSHTIVLGYNPQTQTWNMIDANQLTSSTTDFHANNAKDIENITQLILNSFYNINNNSPEPISVGFTTQIVEKIPIIAKKTHADRAFFNAFDVGRLKILQEIPAKIASYLLFIAAKHGDKAVVSTLTRNHNKKININVKYNNLTPLSTAINNKHTKIVKLLLGTQGIDVNSANLYQETPLFIAARNGYEKIVELLLNMKDLDVDHENKHDETPLFIAAANGQTEIVKLLLDVKGINVDWYNLYNETPLFIAAVNGYTEIVKLLLGVKGIDVNRGNGYDETPLFIAAANGKIEIVKLLLGVKGIGVNAATLDGETPLYIASNNGHKEIVKLLLNMKKIDVNVPDKRGILPLDVAIINKHMEIATLLLVKTKIKYNNLTPLYTTTTKKPYINKKDKKQARGLAPKKNT